MYGDFVKYSDTAGSLNADASIPSSFFWDGFLKGPEAGGYIR